VQSDTSTADECVQLSSAITTGTTFTVSLWMKPDTGDSGFLFGQDNPNGIKHGSNGRINYQYSGADHQNSTNNLILTNIWNHIVVSVNSATATFYINGAADGTASNVISMNAARIGGAGGQSSFYGSMDEVRVYNRALSASEVKELYNQGR